MEGKPTSGPAAPSARGRLCGRLTSRASLSEAASTLRSDPGSLGWRLPAGSGEDRPVSRHHHRHRRPPEQEQMLLPTRSRPALHWLLLFAQGTERFLVHTPEPRWNGPHAVLPSAWAAPTWSSSSFQTPMSPASSRGASSPLRSHTVLRTEGAAGQAHPCPRF